MLPLVQKLLTSNENETIEKPSYPTVVIIVPNKELSRQVVTMFNKLFSPLNLSVDFASELTDRWPFSKSSPPDFLVCTPRFLANFVKGSLIRNEFFFRALKHIVFDEADMLLEGSYFRDTDTILSALKLVRRKMVNEGLVLVHEKSWQTIVSAATVPNYGEKSVDKEIQFRFPLVQYALL
jgi:superfamily II DNA/RNA helicase